MEPRRWSEARNLLCVRLDTIGDVLMSTPAIRALKESVPDRRITLLTSSAAAPTARLVPEIDRVIVYDPPWMKATPPRKNSARELARIESLRTMRFDAAVVFTVFSQNPLPSATMCYLADIPLRLAHCRENPYQLLTDWVRETEPSSGIRHEVRRQLDLVATVGATTADEHLSMRVPPAARRRLAAALAARGIAEDEPVAVIHPGATAPSRRWPPERFGVVADRLARAGLRVVFTGHADEGDRVAAAMAGMRSPSVDLSGTLDIAGLAALISRAAILVTNNTGPAHLAAALATPVVDVYALTNPQHTPWQVPSRVLTNPVPCGDCFSSTCRTGHHRCLLGIRASQAAEAALDLLAETSAALPAALSSERSETLSPPLSRASAGAAKIGRAVLG